MTLLEVAYRKPILSNRSFDWVGERFDIKDDQVELPTRSKGPFLRFQRPLRFLMRLVVRLAISPRSLLVSYLIYGGFTGWFEFLHSKKIKFSS